MTTLVVQELKEDFIHYLREIDLDPVETTLDKSIKKERFYDICEDGLDVSLDHREIPGDVDGVEAAWPRVDRQGTYLPVDLELNWLIREITEVNWMEVWRDYYGQAMLITRQPTKTLVPQCGPGHRSVRWMAIQRAPGSDWLWLEKGCSGELHRDYRRGHHLVVLYRWPELRLPAQRASHQGDGEAYATTTDLTQREKAEVLRAHVNLGHPHSREFVRLLKAAGTRENVIQYVLREFVCAGCSKERRPPTRLPSATPPQEAAGR